MMKILVAVALAMSAVGSHARMSVRQYPSCDIETQRAVRGDIGGAIGDPRQAHVSVRANVLQADLGNARKARLLSQPAADRLYRRVEAARSGADSYVREQGFLSAAEVASYDRALDAVAMRLCRSRPTGRSG